MLSPKVIELRRGSAHSGAPGQRLAKLSARPVQPAAELRQLKYFVANGEDLHARRVAERPLRLAA
jgi:hypothetical protein